MDEKFNTILSIVLIPQIIDIIVNKDQIDEISAINDFYQSKTYEYLSKEETKMWHYSPMTIYLVWKREKETGEIIFPEG